MRPLALALLLALPAQALAGERLWTEGKAKGALRPNAPIDIRSFTRLARTLGPAVVNVVALQRAGGGRSESAVPPGGGQPERPPGRGLGTGFVIHPSGYILTNTHVVDSSDDIRVRLSDDRELSARLIGKDERTDLALLKIEAGGRLAVAPLGDSDQVQIGEWVVAIGNPFGLDHTVTAGIISAKGRRDVRPGGAQTGFYDFIQTDASINPGNSGGPLINTRGEVIGINTAMNAQAQGIGFAIPINMAKVIVPLLASHGRAPRSWLGVFPQSVTLPLMRAFRVKDRRGALVAEVVPDSPAASAGLQIGDVIIELDGHPIRRADDLTWMVSTAPAGKRVNVSVIRAGRPFRVELALAAAPDDESAPAPPPPAPGRRSPLGMTVSEISSGIARELGASSRRGVVVMQVEPDSPAIEAGVQRGDLILRVGDLVVTALEDYARAVRAVPGGELLRMLLRRQGKNTWVAFPKR